MKESNCTFLSEFNTLKEHLEILLNLNSDFIKIMYFPEAPKSLDVAHLLFYNDVNL